MKEKISIKKIIIIAVCLVLVAFCIWFKFPRTLNSFVREEDVHLVVISLLDMSEGGDVKNAAIEDADKIAEFCEKMYKYRFSQYVFETQGNLSYAGNLRISVQFCTTLDDGTVTSVTLDVDSYSVSITGVGLEAETKTYSADLFGNKNVQEIYDYILAAFNANYTG